MPGTRLAFRLAFRRPHVPYAQGIRHGARAPRVCASDITELLCFCAQPPAVSPGDLRAACSLLPPVSPRAWGCKVPGPWRCSVLPFLPRMTFLPALLPPSPATPPRPRTHPPPGPARPVICASLLPSRHLPRTALASTRWCLPEQISWGGRGLDNGRRHGGGRRLGFQPWHCLDSQLDAAWLWALVSSLSWLDGWEN